MTQLDIAQPRLSADEPSFDVFWEATQERTPVEFDYRRSGQQDRAPGTSSRGASSATPVVGTSSGSTPTGEGAGLPALAGRRARRRDGAPGSYDIPAGTDVRDIARRLAPRRSPSGSWSWSAPAPRCRCGGLRSRSRRRAGPDDATGWDRMVLTRGATGMADEVLGYGPAVYVESPRVARATSLARLRGGRRVNRTAAAGAKDQVARLLTLVPLLHAHGEMPLDAAAGRSASPPAQVLSDLKVLFMVRPAGWLPG